MASKLDDIGYHILIPAYQPRHNLRDIIHNIVELSPILRSIVVVDDGSTLEESRLTLDKLKNPPKITVIHNDTNMGKGAALKAGMRQLLPSLREGEVIVTADADGQHLPADIVAVAEHALKHQQSTFGCRAFKGYIPLRSRIGNTLISISLRMLTGVAVKDTQTGLRALTEKDCRKILHLPGEGYEYEFNCLIHLIKTIPKGPIQFPITTVYEPSNPTSHFNPVFDSLKIYFTFLRYVSVSFVAAIIDVSIFTTLTLLHINTLPALLISRTLSLPVYFMGMRNQVFKKRRAMMLPFLGTCGLVVVNIIYLWQLIEFLNQVFDIYRWVAMVIGSTIFFVCNFLIQNYLLYRPRQRKARATRQ